MRRSSTVFPARDQVDVDLLHPLAGDEAQRSIPGCRHQIETTFVHEGHHLVGGIGGLDLYLAGGLFFETGDPVELGIGFTAFNVTRPGNDTHLAFAGAEFRHHVGQCTVCAVMADAISATENVFRRCCH